MAVKDHPMHRCTWLLLSLGMLVSSTTPAQSKPDSNSDQVHAVNSGLTCNATDILKAKIHMAIHNALRYPASTAFYAATGVTTVKYIYLDGRVSDARISESSGNRILDRTALRAVKDAHYPKAPAVLNGIKIPDIIYFVFDNSDLMYRSSRPTDSSNALRRQLSKDEKCSKA